MGFVQVVRIYDEEATFSRVFGYPDTDEFVDYYLHFDGIDARVKIEPGGLMRRAMTQFPDIISEEPRRAPVVHSLSRLMDLGLGTREQPQEEARISIEIASNEFRWSMECPRSNLFQLTQPLPENAFLMNEQGWALLNQSVVGARDAILEALTELLGPGDRGNNEFKTSWTATIADLTNRREALAEAMVNFIRTAHSAVG